MRAVLQRVQSSSVVVDNQTVGAIQKGTLVLLGVAQGDTPGDAIALADKTVGLRIFDDEAGKMNLSIADVGGAILVVSQFTLLADCRKGRRPNFLQAAPPDQAKNLYEIYCEQIRKLGIPVQQGIFQANMQVSLINDGPVTIVLESPANSPSE